MKLYALFVMSIMVLALGCVNTPPVNNGSNNGGNIVEVDIEGFEFVPSSITLEAGQTLRFVNNSGFAHDIHVKQNGQDVFPKTQVNAGSSVDVPIINSGTYELICDRHLPGMIGTITAT